MGRSHYLGMYNIEGCESTPSSGECSLDVRDGAVVLYFLALWAGALFLTLAIVAYLPWAVLLFSSLVTSRARG